MQAIRHKLHLENKERFVDKERKGYYEDKLICTLLDPRFNLLNFNRSTKAMKKNAEKYLKANNKSDWSPKVRTANALATPVPADKGARSFVPALALSSPPQNVTKNKIHTNYNLD